jgi:hypothetical protein
VPDHDEPQSTLLNAEQMARRIGVRTGWLNGNADLGKITAVRSGRRWLFDPSVVEREVLAMIDASPRFAPQPRRDQPLWADRWWELEVDVQARMLAYSWLIADEQGVDRYLAGLELLGLKVDIVGRMGRPPVSQEVKDELRKRQGW